MVFLEGIAAFYAGGLFILCARVALDRLYPGAAAGGEGLATAAAFLVTVLFSAGLAMLASAVLADPSPARLTALGGALAGVVAALMASRAVLGALWPAPGAPTAQPGDVVPAPA